MYSNTISKFMQILFKDKLNNVLRISPADEVNDDFYISSFSWSDLDYSGTILPLDDITKIEIDNRCKKIITDRSQKCIIFEDKFYDRSGTKRISYHKFLLWMCYDGTVPSDIYEIYSEAFCGKELRKKVTIPGTIKSFNISSLNYSNIDTLVIEEGVKSIKGKLGEVYSFPKKIYIPNSVTEFPLLSRVQLKHCVFKKDNPNFQIIDNFLIDVNKQEVICNINNKENHISYNGKILGKNFLKGYKTTGSFEVPESFDEVESSAFSGTKFEEIVFKGSLKKLHANAFIKSSVERIVALKTDFKVLNKTKLGILCTKGFLKEYRLGNKDITDKLIGDYSKFINDNISEFAEDENLYYFIERENTITKLSLEILVESGISNPEFKNTVLSKLSGSTQNTEMKSFDDLVDDEDEYEKWFKMHFKYVRTGKKITIKSSNLTSGSIHLPKSDESHRYKYKSDYDSAIFANGDFDNLYIDQDIDDCCLFYNCKAKNVYIGDDIIDLKSMYFSCHAENLYIGKNVRDIDSLYTLSDNYKHIYISTENKYFESNEDGTSIWTKKGQVILTKNPFSLGSNINTLLDDSCTFNLSEINNLSKNIVNIGSCCEIDKGCNNKVITINDNIKSLEICDTSNNVKLKELKIGKKCKITRDLFTYLNCDKIVFDKDNPYFESKRIGDEDYIFDKKTSYLVFINTQNDIVKINEQIDKIDFDYVMGLIPEKIYVIPKTVKSLKFERVWDYNIDTIFGFSEKAKEISNKMLRMKLVNQRSVILGINFEIEKWRIDKEDNVFNYIINDKYISKVIIVKNETSLDFSKNSSKYELIDLTIRDWNNNLKSLRVDSSLMNLKLMFSDREGFILADKTIYINGSRKECEESGLSYYLDFYKTKGATIKYN